MYCFSTIVPRKYMPKISAVGLFCCDKFEETPIKKVCNMSKLSESYFNSKDSTNENKGHIINKKK